MSASPSTTPAAPSAGGAAEKAGALGGHARRGVAWLGVGRAMGSLIAAGRLVVVARLIGPESIGSFGVALLILGLFDVLSQTGLGQALIQRQGDVRPYLATAWGVQAIRGVVLAAILLVAAPWVAAAFGAAEVTPLLRALAVVPALAGVQALVEVQLHRSLAFGRVTALQTATSVVEAAVTIGIALATPSAWALVAGRIVATAFVVAASWAISPDRRLLLRGVSWRKLRELHRFGFWIFVSALVGFCLIRGGDLVIARLLDLETLGHYQMATVLATFAAMEVARLTNNVAFPLYSRLAGEPGRLRHAYYRTFLALANGVLLAAAVTSVAAEALVALTLGPKFPDVVPLLLPLSIWGACRALGAASSALLQAVGQPRQATIAQLAMLAMFAIGVYPATTLGGALGLSWLLAGVGTVVHFARYEVLYRALGGTRTALWLRAGLPIAAGVVAWSSGRVTAWAAADLPAAATLALAVAAAAAAYWVTLPIFGRALGVDVFGPILDVLPGRVRNHRWARRPLARLAALAAPARQPVG